MSTDIVDTQIPVSSDMRDQLRACKRGGERYEDLFQRLLAEAQTVSYPSDDGEKGKR